MRVCLSVEWWPMASTTTPRGGGPARCLCCSGPAQRPVSCYFQTGNFAFSALPTSVDVTRPQRTGRMGPNFLRTLLNSQPPTKGSQGWNCHHLFREAQGHHTTLEGVQRVQACMKCNFPRKIKKASNAYPSLP